MPPRSKADHPPDQRPPASAEGTEQSHTWASLWGEECWAEGFVAVPNRLLTHAGAIGLDAVGLALVVHLLSFARPGSSPWPAIKTLASRLGLSERHLRRQVVSLEEAGLVQRQARLGSSSAFDFGGLVQRLKAQIKATPVISSRGDTHVTPGRQCPPRTSASALDTSGRPPRTRAAVRPGHQRPPKQKAVKQMTEAEDSSSPAAALARLVKEGVSRKTAAKLVSECGPEVVEQQLEWLPHRKADDPVRVLVASIREGWGRPRMSGRVLPAPPEAFGKGGPSKF